jgi:hypothetical protein
MNDRRKKPPASLREQFGETLIRQTHCMIVQRELGAEGASAYKRLELELAQGIRALARDDKELIIKLQRHMRGNG